MKKLYAVMVLFIVAVIPAVAAAQECGGAPLPVELERGKKAFLTDDTLEMGDMILSQPLCWAGVKNKWNFTCKYRLTKDTSQSAPGWDVNDYGINMRFHVYQLVNGKVVFHRIEKAHPMWMNCPDHVFNPDVHTFDPTATGIAYHFYQVGANAPKPKSKN